MDFVLLYNEINKILFQPLAWRFDVDGYLGALNLFVKLLPGFRGDLIIFCQWLTQIQVPFSILVPLIATVYFNNKLKIGGTGT